MKRFLLSLLVVCLLAGYASAGMYTLDVDTALQFTSYSDDYGELKYVGTDPVTYQGDSGMQGAVGYRGQFDLAGEMTISFADDPDLSNPSGSFDGFQASFGNDNGDNWSVRLFITIDDATYYSGNVDDEWWTPIAPGESEWLTLNTAFDFASVDDFGFEIKGSADVFHLSAIVPVPAAVLIGMLGLGVAGLKLRKFV